MEKGVEKLTIGTSNLNLYRHFRMYDSNSDIAIRPDEFGIKHYLVFYVFDTITYTSGGWDPISTLLIDAEASPITRSLAYLL